MSKHPDTTTCCTNWINQINAGTPDESWFCKEHSEPVWPNRNKYGQQTTDSGHVIKESERIAEDIRQLLVNNNPDGLMELGSDDVQALADFIVSYGSDMYFKGCRTHPEAKALLDRFKAAAEASLPERKTKDPSNMVNEANLRAWQDGYYKCLKECRYALRSVSMEDIHE